MAHMFPVCGLGVSCHPTPAALLPTVASPVLVVFPKEVEAFAPKPRNDPPPPASLLTEVFLISSLCFEAADIIATVDC